MPLVHSKTPRAFKKNIKTEIAHGKPQKQAVAIAYSEQRRAAHSRHASGGEIENCPECMADGGEVEHKPGDVTILASDKMPLKQLSVTLPKDQHEKRGKAIARRHIEQNRMINPNLKGLAHGGEVEHYEDNETTVGSSSDNSPGLLDQVGDWIDKKTGNYQPPGPNLPTGSRAGSDTGAKKLGEGAKKAGMAEGGEVEGHDDDSEISDLLGQELMEAFESKDRKRIMESIEACVLQFLDKEESYD